MRLGFCRDRRIVRPVQRHFELRCETPDDRHGELSVVGELDLASASVLREQLGELMGTGRRDVLIDLAATEFLDSSGIGALLWAHHRLEAAGGHLTLVNARGTVARTLQLTGADRVLGDPPATPLA
jgi:anti-sigma B factor antagonist